MHRPVLFRLFFTLLVTSAHSLGGTGDSSASRTIPALQSALDAAWADDDWQAGLSRAQTALREHPDEPRLRGRIVRALWRAGRLPEAERLATLIAADTTDPVALRSLIEIHLANGRTAAAQRTAARLQALPPRDAEDFYALLMARLAADQMTGLARLVRELEKRVDPTKGYPHTHLTESIDGLAEYLEAVGAEPLNQVTRFGSAPMPPLVMLGMPACEVYINDRGPYRFIVDTGGSIMVAIDTAVSDEVGLRSLGSASVHGVSGLQETEQVLLDELRLGSITCRRVLARVFPFRAAVMNMADGLIGTGIFADTRMILDFDTGEITLAPSSDEPAAGTLLDLRIIADAKLMALITLNEQAGVAMLDSGADVIALSPTSVKLLCPDADMRMFDPGIGMGIGSDRMPRVALTAGVDLRIADRLYPDYGGIALDTLDDLLSPIMGVQTDVLIGMPLFRDTRTCTVDYPRCKMWIDWLPRENARGGTRTRTGNAH